MFTAEVEFLVGQLTKQNEDVITLERVTVGMRNGSGLAASDQAISALVAQIKKGLLQIKGRRGVKLIYLVDFEEQEPAALAQTVRGASILANLVKTGTNELGAICINVDGSGNLSGFGCSPAAIRFAEILPRVFSSDTLRFNKGPATITFSPENHQGLVGDLNESHARLIGVLRGFAQTGNIGVLESVPDLAQDLRSFYETRSFSETFSSNSKFFITMLLGFFIFQGARFFESYLVMSLDEEALQASALALSVMRVFILFGTRPLESVTLMTSVAHSAKNYDEQGKILRGGYVTATVSALVSMVFLLTSRFWLRSVLQQNEQVSEMAGKFLNIYAIGMLPLTVSVASNNLLFGRDEPGVPSIIELLNAVLGSILTWALVKGKMGSPVYGLNGYAISLAAQKWFNFIFVSLYFYCSRKSRQYSVLSGDRMSELGSKVKATVRLGLPLALQIGSEQLYLFIIAVYAGWLSQEKLGQANVFIEYFSFLSITASLVLHKTTMQKVGEVVGRDLMQKKQEAPDLSLVQSNLKNIRVIAKSNVILSSVYLTIIGVVFLTLHKQLVELYVKNQTEQDQSILTHHNGALFAIIFVGMIADQYRNLQGGVANGLGDVDSPAWTSLCLTVLVGGGLAAALTFPAKLGLEGAFSASFVAYALGGLLLTKVTNSLYKRLASDTDSMPISGSSLFCCRRASGEQDSATMGLLALDTEPREAGYGSVN